MARAHGGQALPLVCLVLALTAATGLVAVKAGEVVVDRTDAATAADAAALAGATGGREAAATAAGANGAVLVSWRAAGPDVEVVVQRHRARARARARAAP